MRSSTFRLGVLVAVYAALVITWFGFVVDDAMIAARYGSNLAERGELVFNGAERIMAFSSPLQVFIVAALRLVAADPLALYRGLAAILVPVVLVWVGKRLLTTASELVAFLLLTLLSPFVVLWTSGDSRHHCCCAW